MNKQIELGDTVKDKKDSLFRQQSKLNKTVLEHSRRILLEWKRSNDVWLVSYLMILVWGIIGWLL